MKLTVCVTEEDIRQGVRGNTIMCPVSRALRRTTGQQWDVNSEQIITPCSAVELPLDAYQFVEDFDAQKPVNPFSFTLEVPDTLFKNESTPPQAPQ